MMCDFRSDLNKVSKTRMTLQELQDRFGTWLNVALELKISTSGPYYWRKRGSIPMDAQRTIQLKTNNALIAREEDDLKLSDKIKNRLKL